MDAGPSFQQPPHDSIEFDQLIDENPVPGQLSRVFVRIRNRGPSIAKDVEVRLYRAPGSSLPVRFPKEYWKGYPLASGRSDWQSLGLQIIPTISYSGCSVAGSDEDKAVILRFDWAVPPSTNANVPDALLAFVDCAQDPLTSLGGNLDEVVPSDNNVAMRRILINP